ncbi:hypothetical protein AWC38_SpisGene22907 [Stylophora pistillata]|uniref:Uncharacterized protein n=1 Tax=Stylophora pistillata TaxID=50429 RepID=A0A2B4R9Z1_STYPI|nr:hypothetical protein AWC38_SpisGene22907 [Stylophora pistillata]
MYGVGLVAFRSGSVVAEVEMKFGKSVTDPLKPLEDEIKDGKLGAFTVNRELDFNITTPPPASLFSTTSEEPDQPSNNAPFSGLTQSELWGIIGGCIAFVLVVIIIIVVSSIYCRKSKGGGASKGGRKKYSEVGGYLSNLRHHRLEDRIDIQFIAALRELATLWDFGGLCDEMIRDQLIEKTCVNRIRERLLLEPDFLTVDRAIQLALQVETAMVEARTLQPSQVQYITRKPVRAHGETKRYPLLAAKPSSERSGCYSEKRSTNCGSDLHDMLDKACPVRAVQSRFCGKANYFAKWCRSKPGAVKQVAQDPKKDVKESETVFNL